jgi:hypothetical protein
MWKKITATTQLTALQAGENIIKYPISGASVSNFEDANPDNISLRVITQNDPLNETLDITVRPSTVKYDAILGLGGVVFGPVKKSYDAIIKEGLWWFFDHSDQE